VDGIPGENANVFTIRSTLKAQQGQSRIGLAGILGSLRLGIRKVRPKTTVDGAIRDFRCADIMVTLLIVRFIQKKNVDSGGFNRPN
jgi:hypothetical protein